MPRPSRRKFLYSWTGALGTVAARAAASRNLVFIIADQHTGFALGSSGHPIVRTPRVDGPARQGVLFTHAYAAGLICAPSRASLDTGLHVQTHGVRTNGVQLRRDIPSIQSIHRRHDYLVGPDPYKEYYGTQTSWTTWSTTPSMPLSGSNSPSG